MLMTIGILVMGALSLFTLYMLLATAAIGTERMKTSQYWLSSLSKNEEASVKLNLLIDKYESNLLTIKVTTNTLIFRNVEDNTKAGEIWIGSKYHAYGMLHRYGASDSNKWQCNKPDLATFKRIIKLEKSLDPNDSTEVKPVKETEKSNNDPVVLD